MCSITGFFDFFTLYFILLCSMTMCRRSVTYKGIFVVFTSFLSVFTFYLSYHFSTILVFNVINEFNWELNTINWQSISIAISLKCDSLSYLFTLLVVVIGLGTNLYVLNYFKYEANEDIFALLINWFIFSMLILVLANNLFTLLLGWESIGLSSFYLINFWSSRRGTVKSSFKAFFFNKISDLFLFLFLVLIFWLLYSNSISLINVKVMLNTVNTTLVYEFAAATLFMCTMFKSAQLFGHLWLPDSMEAPVPASALIHSATLVSAGIYLLLRFTPLIVFNNLHTVAFYIGSVTAAYGAIVSASQTDMKKLLAYSTVSHCGFLFVTISTELYTTSIIYLFLHGLFKALTFFCAGSFIRVAGSQDTRLMGGLNRVLPVDTIFLIICAFNLGGLPFSLGYLYKSSLLTAILSVNTTVVCLGLCIIGLLCSVIYVYRLVYYSAFDVSKEFFLSIYYELQQKQINVVKHFSLTTIVQIIAVYLVFSFSCVIYIYFLSYFFNANISLDYMPVTYLGYSQLTKDCGLLFKHFYEIFYSLYTLVVGVLCILVWRYEYTFLYRLNFLVGAVATSYFVVIYTTLLNF